MKNCLYALIFLLPIPSALLASDIALPKISNDMQKLAKEATSNARIKALNVQKVAPKPSKNLIDQVEKLANQAKKQAETQKNTVNILLNKTVRNAKWKAKQTQLIQSLNKTLDVEDEAKQSETVSGHRLYLFVSSSMPKNKMRQYARQLTKYPNAQMIMRGFIGGGKKMQPTMAYIKSIITKDAHCNRGVACKTYKTKFNIDPVLFQRYQITQVPTLVYVDDISGGGYCSEGNTKIVNTKGVHKFIGLAPIKYMVSELADKTKLSKLQLLKTK